MKNWTNSKLDETLSNLAKQYTPESLVSLINSTSSDDASAQINLLEILYGGTVTYEGMFRDLTAGFKTLSQLLNENEEDNNKRFSHSLKKMVSKISDQEANLQAMLTKIKEETVIKKDINTIVKENPKLFVDANISALITSAVREQSLSSEKVMMNQAYTLINAREKDNHDVTELRNEYTETMEYLKGEKDHDNFMDNLKGCYGNHLEDNSELLLKTFLDRIIQDGGKLSKKNYVKTFFGSPNRNFQDGFIHQAQINPELKSNMLITSLLVLGNNDFVALGNNKQIPAYIYLARVISEGKEASFSKELSTLSREDMIKMGVEKELAKNIWEKVTKIELELELRKKGIE